MGHDGQLILDLDVHDIPPAPQEKLMPPIKAFTYGVLFDYSAYRTPEDFSKNEGKHWSKVQDNFIGPGPGVTAEVARLTSPSDTPEAKLRKIYAAVQQFENTDLTRSRSQNEEKADGLKLNRTTDDVLARKARLRRPTEWPVCRQGSRRRAACVRHGVDQPRSQHLPARVP